MKTIAIRLATAATAVFCLTVFAAPTMALIIIEPFPDQPVNPRALQLTENTVQIKITDRVAEVTAEFVYRNTGRRDLEGTFLFPLPLEAAVDDFSLFVNGEEIKAKLLGRRRARQVYESIVRRQKDPALLEFIDRQLLQARIFPITPRDGAKVRLYYTHPVPADFGAADFVYPLAVEKLEAGSGCRVAINVELISTDPLKTVYSPTHSIDLVQTSENNAQVSCTPTTTGQRSADFHLLVVTADEQVSADFLTCRDKDGLQYFMGMISPGTYDDDEILPKDIIFCLDRSGSMAGDKIKQAKAALRYCLERLNPEDRFGLVIFNSDIEIFHPRLAPAAAETRKAAIEYFDRLPATGGTYLDGALCRSLEMFEKNTRPRYLVFLTDGLPTVGPRDAGKILSHIKEKNHSSARVFAWGVGYDLNAGLINDLAQNTKGAASYVAPEEDLEIKLSHFFERINRPVLSDCKLHIDGVTITEMYPKKLPDMFAGSEVIVVGRYEGGSPVTVTLSGRQGKAFKQYVFHTQFQAHADKYAFLPKLWAGRRIGYLLEDMRRHGEVPEVIDEVVTLSKKYGIITPYTSFLVAPEEPRMALDELDREYDGSLPSGAAPDLGKSTIVRGSKRQPATTDLRSTRRTITSEKIKSMSVTDVDDLMRAQMGAIDCKKGSGDLGGTALGLPAPPPGVSSFKAAGDKSFTLRDGFWIDADLLTGEVPADTVEIERFSEAYFELLRVCPEFGAYLSVGQRVIILYRGVVVVIDDTGETAFRHEWKKWLN